MATYTPPAVHGMQLVTLSGRTTKLQLATQYSDYEARVRCLEWNCNCTIALHARECCLALTWLHPAARIQILYSLTLIMMIDWFNWLPTSQIAHVQDWSTTLLPQHIVLLVALNSILASTVEDLGNCNLQLVATISVVIVNNNCTSFEIDTHKLRFTSAARKPDGSD